MHVTSLTLRNFKRFGEATFDLGRLNLLVGPNNCGKSTVLQALSLFQFCVRSTLRRKNSGYVLEPVSLGQEEFAVIPVADPLDLWKDRKAQHAAKHLKIEVGAELSNRTQVVFLIDLTFNRFGIQPEVRNGSVDGLDSLNIVFVPGYAGFLPREERRTPAVRQALVAQGRHGEIIRNILLDLYGAPDSYQAFQGLLREVFPEIELIEPSFEEKTDLYIRVRYREDGAARERKTKGSKGLDLISAGSGFHQFLQIFSNILYSRPSTLLLDEPDAHLYSTLQNEVLRLFKALLKDRRVEQVLIATHSTEFISRVQPNEIILLGGEQPTRLSQRADIPRVLEGLGAVDNLALLNIRICRRLLLLESGQDAAVLERFLRVLWGDARYLSFSARVVVLPLNGSPLNKDVDGIVDALRRILEPEDALQTFVLSDRDYLFDEERTGKLAELRVKRNQKWYIWGRQEIENYLILLDPVLRVCKEDKELQPLFAVPREQIAAKIEEAIEISRTAVLDKLMNRFQQQDRARTAATCRRLAEQHLADNWGGERRLGLCDAKDVVLPRLREWLHETYHISLSNVRLAEAFSAEEIPQDVKDVASQLSAFAGIDTIQTSLSSGEDTDQA